MSLGVWLLVVGLCDLARAARDVTSPSRRALIVGLGTALLLFAAVVLQPTGWRLVVLLVLWVGFFVLWVLASASALLRRRVPARALAFLGLGGGVVAGILFDPRFTSVPTRIPTALTGWPLEQVVLVLGVSVVQLATANVTVRLVLDAVGVPASTNEKTLKGGRLLGPMERLFVVALGLAGHLTAASIVVAAKGLLRFPELQADSRSAAARQGPSDVTEYFLIGSFASWLFALAGIGLAALGTALP